MKVLVTGGVGFIGTNLIKELLKNGNEVVSIDNYSTGLKENELDGCKYYNVNICDYKNFDQYIEDVDLVFHLAALPRIQPSFKNPLTTFKTNVEGTINLLDWCKEKNVPLVYAGSSSTHGGVYKNPYTFTKWQGEELCKLYSKVYSLQTAICRFYNVYGPHQLTEGEYCTVIGIFERQKNNGEVLTITGDGQQRRDFTHVDDIVDGLIKCGLDLIKEDNSKANGETFELGRGINYSINEVANMFGGEKIYIDQKKGEVRDTLCIDSKAKELLNWNPKRNLEDYIN
ncbi:MAG: NAD-dependent epimerase/dehydratase family protein [Flavobacteriaceae bacterium]|jgi:UDP-glucose 4-epimerase|nr:NAD-dependent epimerase/dehydratase family protein [Flavobacteriaceae bacterium]